MQSAIRQLPQHGGYVLRACAVCGKFQRVRRERHGRPVYCKTCHPLRHDRLERGFPGRRIIK